MKREREQAIGIDLNTDLGVGNYVINDFFPADADFRNLVNSCIYTSTDHVGGILNITFTDYQKFIVSGTFNFLAISNDCQDTVKVTNGRFDLNYIP